MKWIINSGHRRNAICQENARMMLSKDAASTCGRRNLRILCSFLLTLLPLEPIRPWMPLKTRKQTKAMATTLWRMKRRRKNLFVYFVEFSDAKV